MSSSTIPKTTTIFDSNVSLNIRPFFFKKADQWETQTVNNQIGYRGTPGTWLKIESRSAPRLLAFICCPNCKQIRALMRGIHIVDFYGKIKPDLICDVADNVTMHRCSFHRKSYLDRWQKGRPLYAIAVEYHNGKPEIFYCHADNQAEARAHVGPGDYRIIAIGPVIGYEALDADAKKFLV